VILKGYLGLGIGDAHAREMHWLIDQAVRLDSFSSYFDLFMLSKRFKNLTNVE
jgi:hypothetical protein